MQRKNWTTSAFLPAIVLKNSTVTAKGNIAYVSMISTEFVSGGSREMLTMLRLQMIIRRQQ
jgi:hypothetical protein